MKNVERNVVRLAVVQHLRATYGIKTKNWNKGKTSSSKMASNSVKVFGVALESLPHCHVLDYGDIPCFLVDACTCLMLHLDTEGLFRKSGSVVRVKALRVKLDQAEECLATALPLDIAGLLKLFFRELPEPILPTYLQNAFLKAQELPTEEERSSATILLSCVLPHGNLNILRYFFRFLKRVSQRCADNKMDSSNLSVIFAPNLLHCGDGTEKMSASTEKRLKLQAAVVQRFIDNAEDLGVVPEFLIAKVPAMLGCEAEVFSPLDAVQEGNTPSGTKRCRRSIGDMVNGAFNKLKSNRTPTHTFLPEETVLSTGTPVITPKRKLPMESGQSCGFSNKKRRSIKKNLGLELFPNALFGGGSTPGSVHSASGTLGSTPGVLSSVGRSSQLSASSARRKSKRLSHRNINRIESGKAGCFSPRVTKKEASRKSLRLRFSLGKINRDCSVVSNSVPVPKGSEVIGWRLATQESVTSFHFTKDTAFSPSVLTNSTSTGSKFISKSEDNLLTPCSAKQPGTSWNKETPDGTQPYKGSSFSDTPMNACLKATYCSEPIIVNKPPTAGNIPKSLCCATSAESLASSESFREECSKTGPTLVRIRVSDEPGIVLPSSNKDFGEEPTEKLAKDIPASSALSVLSETSLVPTEELLKNSVFLMPQSLVDDQNITFGQIEMVPLSPLHIDSALFETESTGSPLIMNKIQKSFLNVEPGHSCLTVHSSTDSANCSQLLDALDIQSPVAFRLNSSITVQSTPFPVRERTREVNTSQPQDFKESALQEEPSETSSQYGVHLQERQRPEHSMIIAELRRMRVADHIQRFNMLTLNSPKAKVVRSPLKFQRTPVRQSVRRINSLGQRKEARSGWCASSRRTTGMKASSLESGLSTEVPQQDQANECPGQTANKDVSLKMHPGVHPIKSVPSCNVRPCALGDVTNTVAPKANGDGPSTKSKPLEVPKLLLVHATDRDVGHYRGSPKNPLMQGRLLSAMKPLDL